MIRRAGRLALGLTCAGIAYGAAYASGVLSGVLGPRDGLGYPTLGEFLAEIDQAARTAERAVGLDA